MLNSQRADTLFRRTFVPSLLLILCPPAVMIFWYINTALGGSFMKFWSLCADQGFFAVLYTLWKPIFFGSPTAWKMLGTFAAVQLLFMKLIPGKTWLGPITPNGNIPVYKANGVLSYFLTLWLFYLGAYKFDVFSPTIIYDHFGEILGALNFFSLFVCIFLYLKGKYRPSSSDNGSSGNLIFDFYWGTELYPRIFGWDIKMFTNCRFGMMSWGLILLSYAAKQKELYGAISDGMLVSVGLQLIYITKFFFWEKGYLRSLDIMHDRAGYYICWGCLVWLPCIYTSPTLYLVQHPGSLQGFLALIVFTVGAASIIINYLADRQRQHVRLTNGQCLVWGKKPTLTIAAYTTSTGEPKQSLLLASGWWGIARHFHYAPEILGAFCWSVPALFTAFLPYFYVVFLTFLLIERSFRDDRRCAEKYGEDWARHCSLVRYRIVPYLF